MAKKIPKILLYNKKCFESAASTIFAGEFGSGSITKEIESSFFSLQAFLFIHSLCIPLFTATSALTAKGL